MNGAGPASGGEDVDALAQAHHAIAAAQDRSYWLDRWGIDLNAAMRRPSGRRAREAVRLLRSVRRAAIEARRAAGAQLGEVRAIGLDEGDAEIGPAPRGVPVQRLRAAPATDVLFARLEDGDIAAVEQAADGKHSTQLTEADPAARRRLLVALGVQWGVARVSARTGLPPTAPRSGARTPEPWLDATAGALYGADVVADGLASGGIDVSAGARILDFECRDGTVATTLAAAYPECELRAVDRTPPAGEADARPAVSFSTRADAPPLDLADGELDAAYALSAWGRLPSDRARAWLDELHRAIRPGGALVLVARGRHAVARAYDGRHDGAMELDEVDSALTRDGFWHGPVSLGDEHPDDVAFMTPERLLAEATPRWSLAELAPGRVDNDRDVYVLVRR